MMFFLDLYCSPENECVLPPRVKAAFNIHVRNVSLLAPGLGNSATVKWEEEEGGRASSEGL